MKIDYDHKTVWITAEDWTDEMALKIMFNEILIPKFKYRLSDYIRIKNNKNTTIQFERNRKEVITQMTKPKGRPKGSKKGKPQD